MTTTTLQPQHTAPAGTPQLELTDLHKRYGGIRALDGAHLTVSRPGVVHGLIGANGSGKSTLLGILSGQRLPDAGSVRVNGSPVTFTSPLAAVRAGVAMVSQETALAPDLSIAENILLGGRLERRRVTGIDWAASNRRARLAMDELGLHEDPRTRVGSLRPDRQQLVEIARAISLDARILVLDEPTSSLGEAEVQALFATVRRLQERGVSTIFVSHRLDELTALADELTVLRDGRTVAAGPIEEFDIARIVSAMVGDADTGRSTRTDGAGPVARDVERAATLPDVPAPRLRIRDLTLPGVLAGLDLDVAVGEVVGLAGVVGSGCSEVLASVFGTLPATGTVLLDGEPLARRNPRAAIDRGLGYLPPDRKEQGLVLQQSVGDNLAMVATRDVNRLRVPAGSAVRRLVAAAVREMRIVTASPASRVGTLSGGNQQKVALGKWHAAESQVLLLDEPTRGVDVVAKAEIHRLLRASAADGAALLVSSSETPELLELCDRIVVLSRGRVVATLTSAEASEEVIARLAGGDS